MDQPSWGGDSPKYMGMKREKVIDWLHGINQESYDVTAARVDRQPVFYENMYDQRWAKLR